MGLHDSEQAGAVIDAMLASLDGGELHVRPPLAVSADAPFLRYIEIGWALRDCMHDPALREGMVTRLAPHRSLIIGPLPAGLAQYGLLPPVDAAQRATLGFRSLAAIGDDELRQWLVDDSRLIYGEWKREELAKYFAAIAGRIQPGSLMVDLGSGLGKVVMTAALTLPFGRCVGVELLAYRHAMALERGRRMLEIANERGAGALAADLAQRMAFIEADMFAVDCSAADLVFIYSTCFAALMDALGEKLARELREGALVSTTTFPLRHPAFRLVEHFPSGAICWTSVFLYERHGALDQLPPAEPAQLWQPDEAEWSAQARAELARLATS